MRTAQVTNYVVILRRITDGERFAAHYAGGRLVAAVGPLHERDIAAALVGDFDDDAEVRADICAYPARYRSED